MAEDTNNENSNENMENGPRSETNEPAEETTQPETKPAVSVEVEEREDIKRQYIISFIINPALGVGESEGARTGLNQKIVSHAGSVSTSICQESPKNLAYPIGKTSQAYFCETVFETNTEKVKNIEEEFKNDANVVRYLLEVKRAPSRKQQKRRVAQYRPKTGVAGVGKEGADSKTESATTADRERVSVEEIEKKIDEIIDNI